MTSTSTEKPTPSSTKSAKPDSAVATKESSPLSTPEGTTSIADSVVQKIVGIAVRQVSGVHDLGGSGARAFGALRTRIPGSSGPSITQGVSVEVGERQAAVDLNVILDYGVAIAELTQTIRDNVIRSVEGMTGLSVSEVNISVDDVYIAGDTEDESSEPSRVQ